MQAMLHTSFWQETAQDTVRRYPALDRDLEADVVIVGAGITGLTAARHLLEAGRRVVLLEGGLIAGGTSGYTTAHLDATTDNPLHQMISDFGEESAQAIVAASRQAIDQIEMWCRTFHDCEFARLPSYEYTESEDGLRHLQDELLAARKLGLPVAFTQTIPLPFASRGGLRMDQQGRVHAGRYLHRLAASVAALGGQIFENTTAQPPDDGEPCQLETTGGKVSAREVFLATHSPFLGISSLDTRVYPYQSYVIAARVEEEVPDALFWDNADPYHYIRQATPSDPHLLLIGGADHKTGQRGDERQSFEQLERYAHERFEVRGIEHRWSAEYFAPADGLPHIGRAPACKHLWVSTGYNGTGMTYGTVGGRLVADLILGRENPLADVLKPGRFTPLASASDFVTENLDAARRFVGDRFGSKRIESLDEVAPGQGQIVLLHGQQLAAYREPSGQLHTLSPVCTHAGCIVQWNEAERTWDCPCHGGRYSATGQRVYGPPPRDLAPERPTER